MSASFSTPRCVCLMLVLSSMCWSAATAQTPAAIDTSAIGPQVGQQIPEFAGTDQFGRPHTLSSSGGVKGTMLVFFRSADW
jgi:hypothetical protein